MSRRFSLLAAVLGGALAAIAALPLVTACQHNGSEASVGSFMAADAHAAAGAPATADTVRQAGPMPSLAPIVKQLRPVVVNVNSRFKPRRPAVAQRGLPRGHPPVRPGPED